MLNSKSLVKELDFCEYLEALKKKKNFKVIDTHIHPLDVMGVVHYTDKLGKKENKDIFKVGILEKMNFNILSNLIYRYAFIYLQSVVASDIRNTFSGANEKRLLAEMDKSLVDKAVLLPVEPWSKTNVVAKDYRNGRFLLLGSLDIHNIKLRDIEKTIIGYKKNHNIVGLKLHPNLQGFKPQPSQNNKVIGDKLRIIYKTADRLNLYLLFHGGLSSYTKYVNEKYKKQARSKNFALIDNFIDTNGKSELFESYNNPIILAHLGHFGLNKINQPLIKKIVESYPNVYFDTAASSPKMIAKMVKVVGYERILLGSDGIYNRMSHSIFIAYMAVKKSGISDLENAICAILGNNYRNKIIGRN